jgi:hypothetical protein
MFVSKRKLNAARAIRKRARLAKNARCSVSFV